MDKIVKLLCKTLSYVKHDIVGDTIFITVKSLKKSVKCPYCGRSSSKKHSFYERSFQDLPIQGKKVIYVLRNRKFFCQNPDCEHLTFAESFDFLSFKGKKTKRLEESIVEQSLHISSLTAAKQFKRNLVDVGKSTICNLLKKRRKNKARQK
jgi:transposase